MSIHSSEQLALLALEEQLEMHALDSGIARYRAERERNDPSNGTPEQTLIGMCLDTLIPAIENLQDHVAQGKPAKGVTHWGYPLLSLPADKLAFLTLAEIVNHADSGEASTSTIALAIGSRAKVEREFDIIRKQARDVYTYLLKRNKNWTRRAHRTAKAKAGGVDVEWSQTMKAWLGMTLLEQAVSFTDVLTLERQFLQGKSRIIVRLKPEVRAVIEKSHGECELLRPSYLPMVVPPNDWSDQTNGGYIWHRNSLVKRNRLAKATATNQKIDMPLVFHAINTMQRTGWQINQPVLATLAAVWNAGGGWASLPDANPMEIPRPSFNWDTAATEQKREWKLQASRLHDENARLVSQRKAILQKLWIAQQLKTREAIYFPYQLDWRGRAYPLPANLHPQTDDVGRGLLRFARGEPLGASGLKWLRIHLANCYGVDKVPFAEREQWTVKNLDNIRQSAANPLDYRWWAEGENPWQTLAACLELATANEESMSYIPIQMDGSCNGLQHYSAMGRDPVGGRAVNLIPSDKPSDVYAQVAGRVNELIEEEICNAPTVRTTSSPTPDGSCIFVPSKNTPTGSKPTALDAIPTSPAKGTSPLDSSGRNRKEMPECPVASTEDGLAPSSFLREQSALSSAIAWRGQVDRKVVKRATMTIVYGLTRQGMKQQFLDDGHCDSLDGNLNQNASYMTGLTMMALSGVLTGASAIMDWLRTVAKIASERNVAITWTTPAGFPVKQEYVEQRVRHLYTAMQKLTLREPDEKGEISLSRQMRGLPPNFVHSFDAAHMMLSVNAARTAGITAFSMIHDSYGTHAAHIDTLHRCLREEFVKMYEPPVLTHLHQQWSVEIGVELPPPPEPGTLDLTQVLKSPYFFA